MIRNRMSNIKKPRIGYIFILPALILIIIFIVYPLINGFITSFCDWKLIGEKVFIGINNFKELIKDEVFQKSIYNNFIYAASVTAGTILIGFILAVFLDSRIKGWQVFKVVFFIPIMLSMAVISILWVKILEPNAGIVNAFLRTIGLDFMARGWLGDPKTVFMCIILISIWMYSGFTMVFLLAAMQNVPKELYESAKLDGANFLRCVIHITLPMIRTVFVIVTMLMLIFSFKVFDIVWIMTKGGPGFTTFVMGVDLYYNAFNLMQFGYGSAIAVFMFIFIAGLSIIYLRSTKFEEKIIEY